MKKKLNKDKALAYGEVTFHSHRVDVDVYEYEDGLREFNGKTTVVHEEHKSISLPEGEYYSDQVIENDHVNQMVRKVQD